MKVKIINKSGFELPRYETEGAAAFDIRACLPIENMTIELEPLASTKINTGLYVSIPKSYEMQIRPRSGLAAKHQITVTNAPGTIDSDYRGEICILLTNLGQAPFKIQHGDRIAQGVICPIIQAEWEEVDELDGTERGEGGFGHTGTK